MRIALIAPPWLPVPPPAYGGTERVLDDLCRALSAAGHDVLLYATGDSSCPVERAWTHQHALGTDGASPAPEVCHVIDAYDTIRRWRPDVVHDHTLFGPFHAQQHADLVVVTTNHGPFTGHLGAVYRKLAGRVPIIAISRDQASRAEGTTIASVIHHGIDLAGYPIGAGGGGYAVFLGRMCADKGVHLAAQVARAAGLPLRIAAKAAEPPERRYFRSVVEPLLGGGVEYVGEVGGEAKLALLADAACLLNPIDWPEPFGMVMIESLACGTPVVATRAGAAPEIVDDGVTGFLRADPAALVPLLVRAATLDRRACRLAVEERFTAGRMAADHVAVYERAIARRRADAA